VIVGMQRHSYYPVTAVARVDVERLPLVDVPELQFAMIDGHGDPNVAPEYRGAMQALCAVAYAVRFALKRAPVGLDFGVMPLESLWWVPDMAAFTIDDKSNWDWTAMIMQPDQVTQETFDAARATAAKKKSSLEAIERVRLERFTEGRAAQVLHIGPYAAEGPTIARLHAFIADQGYERAGKHHEIYWRRRIGARLPLGLRSTTAASETARVDDDLATVRHVLAVLRAEGVPFADAWEAALPTVRDANVTLRQALAETQAGWRRAFQRRAADRQRRCRSAPIRRMVRARRRRGSPRRACRREGRLVVVDRQSDRAQVVAPGRVHLAHDSERRHREAQPLEIRIAHDDHRAAPVVLRPSEPHHEMQQHAVNGRARDRKTDMGCVRVEIGDALVRYRGIVTRDRRSIQPRKRRRVGNEDGRQFLVRRIVPGGLRRSLIAVRIEQPSRVLSGGEAQRRVIGDPARPSVRLVGLRAVDDERPSLRAEQYGRRSEDRL
jgi:hypothetical protein